jgi:hypothetical protein
MVSIIVIEIYFILCLNRVRNKEIIVNKQNIKFALYLAVGVFFLTTIWLAYHYHDLSYSYSTCSICKMKSSIASASKTKIYTPFQFTAQSVPLQEFFLNENGKVFKEKAFIQKSITFHPFSNKAPPVQS